MGRLAAAVRLHDILDLDRWVAATISRHPCLSQTRGDERDELEAEGYRIVLELEQQWDRSVGTFSGFVTSRLTFRLVDWLHGWRGDLRQDRLGPRRYERPVVVSYEREFALA
jgi:hypothetical protein